MYTLPITATELRVALGVTGAEAAQAQLVPALIGRSGDFIRSVIPAAERSDLGSRAVEGFWFQHG